MGAAQLAAAADPQLLSIDIGSQPLAMRWRNWESRRTWPSSFTTMRKYTSQVTCAKWEVHCQGALEKLLENSGLGYEFLDKRTVAIRIPALVRRRERMARSSWTYG